MLKTHRRLIAVASFALALATWAPAHAEVDGGTSLSVTQTSQTITFASTHGSVTIINDSASANEIYFRLFTTADTVAAATTAGVRLEPGESLSFSFSSFSEPGTGYSAASIVCATGETATARVVSK